MRAHERVVRESLDADVMISQPSEDRHLTCAVLAWHQLGHKDADSLYEFIEERLNKSVHSTSENYFNKDNIDSVNTASVTSISREVVYKPSVYSKDFDNFNFRTDPLMGPVVKLPVETNIVMRLENTPRHIVHDCSRHSGKKMAKIQNDINSKIDAACCMDKACLQRLTEVDKAVSELRTRAAKLARREAERMELLERAESAWKDLELGYQRRLNLALEKEEDLAKQIQATIEERNNYKNACNNLANTLKERSVTAEKDRDRLTSIEKNLCDRACVRLRLSEEAAKADSELADQHCKMNQQDRDILFKEDEARRKGSAVESEVQSRQCLTHEAERSRRNELSALKEQVVKVANELLAEESRGRGTKNELSELRTVKDNILDDLNGCKAMCDNNMKGKLDELKKKREKLLELKNKVIECRCKLPIDVAVEVKRTPSLAELCNCAPEDKFLDSCSCTSLRSQLLSNLLSDLFGGLQSELNEFESKMPCQLLKCLEDKHNWEARSSVVKTNLNNFFEQLLVSELDIAIATSIEKYHAKWVGASCTDAVPMSPDPEDMDEGWQNRAIERRAQILATHLAEQLFNERAEQVVKRTKDIVTKGPPPCKCENQSAVFPCLVRTPITTQNSRKTETTPPYLKRTLQDVTQLRVQIEDLRKELIKKEDLRLMEEKITRIVKRVSKSTNIESIGKKNKNRVNDDNIVERANQNTFENITRRENIFRKGIKSVKQQSKQPSDQFGRIVKRDGKIFKTIKQSFAVNLCLCSGQDDVTENLMQNKRKQLIRSIPSFKKLKRITSKGNRGSNICPSQCICLNKKPSTTSIDKLLEKLVKWQCNLKSSSIMEEKQNSDIALEANGSSVLEKNTYITNSTNKIEENNVCYNNNISKYFDTAVDFNSTKEKQDLATGTNSEYIGEIKLDKSNDNCCKCGFYNNYNVKSGNDIDRSVNKSLICVNTNMCHCKMVTETNLNKEQYSSIGNKIDIEKIPQVYSLKFPDAQYDNSSCTCKQSFEIIGESFVGDVIKHSDLLPRDCNYLFKFLGVTLADTNTVSCNNGITRNNKISQSKYQKENQDKTLKIEERKIEYKPHEVMFNQIRKTVTDNEQKCVCCNYKDKEEESNDMELNAFNLLEEHIKGKIAEFQRSSCNSNCISSEEEVMLFTKILNKFKDVISENTEEMSCKCIGINEESWKRAYGLIQEYLRMKIKRVHCSCTSNNNEKKLPKTMEKLTDVIDHDFKRLKEKCKCQNKRYASNHVVKKLNEQMTEPILQYNDVFVQLDDSTKPMLDISIQMLSSPLYDKSCEIILDDIIDVNTAEKEVSCEFSNAYVTDCNCRQAKDIDHFRNNITASNCTESILNDNPKVDCENIDTPLYDPNKVTYTSKVLSKSQLILKHPYIGHTLSCSGDRRLGICHCNKSLSENFKSKIDHIWNANINKSLMNSKNLSCILPNISTKVKSDLYSLNNANETFLSSSVIHVKPGSRKSFCDVELVTSDNEEEIILINKSNYCRADLRNYTEFSTNVGSSNQRHSIDKDYPAIWESNKNLLFRSLNLPTDNIFDSTKTDLVEKNPILESKLECRCEKVPVCHVKMLLEEIEKKCY